MRYEVYPVANENCDSIDKTDLIYSSEDVQDALKNYGREGSFGVGILDTETGLVDFGFGFGVPCPPASAFVDDEE